MTCEEIWALYLAIAWAVIGTSICVGIVCYWWGYDNGKERI